jgi:hypothetical protein
MNIMTGKQSCSAFAAISLLAMNPVSGAANPSQASLPFEKPGVYVERDGGAAERIDVADRLRTLAQELSAAACHLHSDVRPEESRAVLMTAQKEFMDITDALLNGSAKYNIVGRETRPSTLFMITDVISAWTSTDNAMTKLLNAPQDPAAFEAIQASNLHLFDKSSELMGQLMAEYSNPFDLLMGDAVLIDVAGRLGLLTQRISTEVCAIWSGDGTDDQIDALTATIAKFDVAVAALRDGDAEIGIKAAPTAEIEHALDRITADWSKLVKNVNAAVADNTVTEKEKAAVLHSLNEKMYQLDGIVAMYTAYAKNKAT